MKQRTKNMTAREIHDVNMERLQKAYDCTECAMACLAEVTQFINGADADIELHKIGRKLGAVARNICQFKHIYDSSCDEWFRTQNYSRSFKGFAKRVRNFLEDNRWDEYLESAKYAAEANQ